MRRVLLLLVLSVVCWGAAARSVPPSGGDERSPVGSPPSETAVQSIPGPPPIAPPNREQPEVAQAIYDELEKIPFDNKLKYTALTLLTVIPTKLSVVASEALTTEVVKDVALATATGLVNAMDLTPSQRARAKAQIGILKGSGDWVGFVNSLTEITGKNLAIMLATLPPTVADLLSGAKEVPAVGAATSHVVGRRSYPLVVPFYLRVGQELEADCEFDAVKEFYEEVRRKLNESLPKAIFSAGRNYAALTGRPPPQEVVPEYLPRRLSPLDYDPMLFGIYANTYLSDIRDYDNGIEYLKVLGKRLAELAPAKEAYLGELAEVHDWLSQAEVQLAACSVPDGQPLLALARERCCERTLFRGPCKAKSRCWIEAAKGYGLVNGHYYEQASIKVNAKERGEDAWNAGYAALRDCRLGDAISRLVDLEDLLLKEPHCVKDKYSDLRAQIEKFQAEGLCQDRAVAREPQAVGPTGASATASAKIGADCSARRKDYHARCKKLADEHIEKVCTPVYSGCALDVVGCLAALIEAALPDDYCGKPGYVACATGHLDAYLGCLQTCNRNLLLGRINTFQLTDCRLKCQEAVDKGTQQCKASAK